MFPDFASLERLLAFHCAPALAGIKPACLVSLPVRGRSSLSRELAGLGAELAAASIRLFPLCACKNRLLLLVFRTNRLQEHLSSPEPAAFLRKYGYADPSNLRRALAHLRRNFSPPGGFPHEIGVFLGYPLEDVRGFIAGGGEGCKLCGYWKVYGDVERARQSFARYDRCRAALCARIDQGKRLPDIFCRPRNLQRRTFIS